MRGKYFIYPALFVYTIIEPDHIPNSIYISNSPLNDDLMEPYKKAFLPLKAIDGMKI